MRQEEFRMERPGLVKAGDPVKITERVNGSLYSYIIEPSVAMSGIFRSNERIKSKEGVVEEVKDTPRGFQVVVNFNE
ncbi:MAG TPA: hypothetical protein DCZ20_01635 [Lachnospiraceae bacterium]|nr:hypothetical protein [Lachnospiraceae bacterium]